MIMFPGLRRDWGSWSPGYRIQLARRRIRTLINGHVMAGRKGSPTKEVTWLHDLIEATDEIGDRLSEVEVRHEVLPLLVTGFKSTGITLSFLLFHLLRDAGLVDELRLQFGSLSLPRDIDALLEMPLLDSICKEVLRLHPLVPIVIRQVSNPTKLGDFDLSPGAYVLPCIHLAHARQDIFQRPEEFVADRFIGKKFLAYQYMPFGGGARQCIGKFFAIQAMKIVIATVLRTVSPELTDSKNLSVRRKHITIVPRNGVPVRIRRRYGTL